jgi:hypothetical protein
MADYRFLTTWSLDAPLAEVWEAIYCIEKWPEWWKGIEEVTRMRDGDHNEIGSVYAHTWRSWVPYRVHFDIEVTKIEPPYLLEGVARGELEGLGRWRFFEGRGTAVTYEWHVRTTRLWMRAVEPVGRPIFVWSHNVVMRWGGESLARHLGVPLIAQS